MAMECGEERGGPGLFDKREPLEGAGKAGVDGRFIEGGEFQLGHGLGEQADAGHEFLHAVVHEGEIKGAAAVGPGEGAAAVLWVEIVLLGCLFNDKVVETDQFHRAHPFVLLVEDVLGSGFEMLGEHLRDPFGLHRGGEAEKCEGSFRFLAAGGDLVNVGGNEVRRVLHDGFAHELTPAMFGEIAFGFSGFTTFGKLVDEAGHEAAAEGFFVFGGRSFLVVEVLVAGSLKDLLVSLVDLTGDVGIDAVAAAAANVEPAFPREVKGFDQGDEVGVVAFFELLSG